MPGAQEPEKPLPSDVDGTVARLDEAEAELAGALGPAADSAAPLGGAEATTIQEARPPAKKETLAAEAPASEEQQGVARDPCAVACRALASMQRAAAHLCGLTGEQDGRCESARTRAATASARVREACPRCGGW
jgi:hypothetical protein